MLKRKLPLRTSSTVLLPTLLMLLYTSTTFAEKKNMDTSCSPLQNVLQLTLNTDANSFIDNSWKLSHAAYGTVIGAGKISTNDAVVLQTFCADSFAENNLVRAEQACYDLEIHDDFGDGLTLPHSDAGGKPGGWSLHFNGELVAEHRPSACLLENEHGRFNECAKDYGFEYCGVRVCADENGTGAYSVSNLMGSQCNLEERTCESSGVAASSGGSALVTVEVDTDSFGDEFSWELRQSSGGLIMAGGDVVISARRDVTVLGQLGVGVELDDNEVFTSTSCQAHERGHDDEECFDFRAYDAYGDGLGCGADGSISITIDIDGETTLSLLQQDDNMASLQRVDGNKKLACMSEIGLNSWSYCAVRVCRNGEIIGLPGNQCSFGLEGIVDDEALGEIVVFDSSTDPQTQAEVFAKDEPLVQAMEPLQMNSFEPNEDLHEEENGPQTLAEKYESENPEYLGANNSNNQDNTLDFPHILKPKPHIEQQDPVLNSAILEEFEVDINPFYVSLLATDSPFTLEYRSPDDLSFAASLHLMIYLSNIEGWKNNNSPKGTILDCTKSKQVFGSEKRWVMRCEGVALFGSKPLPKKRVMNDLVHQAFARDFREEFIGYMYPEYASNNGIVMTPSSKYMSDDGVIHVFVGGNANKANQGIKQDGKKKNKQQMKKEMDGNQRGRGGMKPSSGVLKPMMDGDVGYTYVNGIFHVIVNGDASKINSKFIKNDEKKNPKQQQMSSGKKDKDKNTDNSGIKPMKQQSGGLLITPSAGYHYEEGVIHVGAKRIKKKKQKKKKKQTQQRQEQNKQQNKDNRRLLRIRTP